MSMTLRPRRVPNFTAPGARANNVSSLLRPTFWPGWKWVPRCRTMISPADTTWPPKRFTPRRWAFESRPLREALAPFLCAMANLLSYYSRRLGSGAPAGSAAGAGSLDAGDLQPGQVLAVALALAVTGLALELEDDDLGAALVLDDLGRHGDLGERRRVRSHLRAVHEEHGGQLNGRTGLTCQPVHDHDVAHRDLLLAATSLHNRVHHVLLISTRLRCARRTGWIRGSPMRAHGSDARKAHRHSRVRNRLPPVKWRRAPRRPPGSRPRSRPGLPRTRPTTRARPRQGRLRRGPLAARRRRPRPAPPRRVPRSRAAAPRRRSRRARAREPQQPPWPRASPSRRRAPRNPAPAAPARPGAARSPAPCACAGSAWAPPRPPPPGRRRRRTSARPARCAR